MATAPATTLDNVKEAYAKYLAGQIVLGDFLTLLNRFLDITVEPEAPPAPAPTPPAPAPATTTKKEDK